MCSTVTRLQQAEYFPGATPSKFQGILYSPWMLGRFLRSRKLFLTCVPVLEWTVSLLKWMASAVQWPERWIHSYSGTAELISHSHEGLRGSLFLYLGVKKEEQEKQKGERRGRKEEIQTGKEEREYEKEKEKRCTVKNALSRGSAVQSPFSPLVSSFPFSGATHHSTRLHAFKAKPGNAVSATVPACHFDKFTIGQPVIFWQELWWDTERSGLLQTD